MRAGVYESASTRTAASQTLIGSGSWPTSKVMLLVVLGIGEALDELGDRSIEIGRLLRTSPGSDSAAARCEP
jgi:hypothetical protein